MPLAYWVNNLSPFLVRFTDSIGIRYYGLAYMLGFLTAGALLIRYARAGRSALPAEKVSDLIMAVIVGVLVGGRLGYFLLYQPDALIHEPLSFFRVWDGGMASHGGFVGVGVALAWFSRSQKIPFLHLCDLIASTAAAGLLLGRVANFINGELWGKVTAVSWAVIFPNSVAPGTPVDLIPPRHPSQLYEAALEGALLLAIMQGRFWRSDIANQTRPFVGRVLADLRRGAHDRGNISRARRGREPDSRTEPRYFLFGVSHRGRHHVYRGEPAPIRRPGAPEKLGELSSTRRFSAVRSVS